MDLKDDNNNKRLTRQNLKRKRDPACVDSNQIYSPELQKLREYKPMEDVDMFPRDMNVDQLKKSLLLLGVTPKYDKGCKKNDWIQQLEQVLKERMPGGRPPKKKALLSSSSSIDEKEKKSKPKSSLVSILPVLICHILNFLNFGNTAALANVCQSLNYVCSLSMQGPPSAAFCSRRVLDSGTLKWRKWPLAKQLQVLKRFGNLRDLKLGGAVGKSLLKTATCSSSHSIEKLSFHPYHLGIPLSNLLLELLVPCKGLRELTVKMIRHDAEQDDPTHNKKRKDEKKKKEKEKKEKKQNANVKESKSKSEIDKLKLQLTSVEKFIWDRSSSKKECNSISSVLEIMPNLTHLTLVHDRFMYTSRSGNIENIGSLCTRLCILNLRNYGVQHATYSSNTQFFIALNGKLLPNLHTLISGQTLVRWTEDHLPSSLTALHMHSKALSNPEFKEIPNLQELGLFNSDYNLSTYASLYSMQNIHTLVLDGCDFDQDFLDSHLWAQLLTLQFEHNEFGTGTILPNLKFIDLGWHTIHSKTITSAEQYDEYVSSPNIRRAGTSKLIRMPGSEYACYNHLSNSHDRSSIALFEFGIEFGVSPSFASSTPTGMDTKEWQEWKEQQEQTKLKAEQILLDTLALLKKVRPGITIRTRFQCLNTASCRICQVLPRKGVPPLTLL